MKLTFACMVALGLSLGVVRAQTETNQVQKGDNPTLSKTNSASTNQIEEPSGAEPRGRAFNETNAPPGRPFSTNNPPQGRPFEDGNVPPGRPFNEGAGAQPGSTNDQQKGTEESKPLDRPGQSDSGTQQGGTQAKPR
jgi:hypothetical protein